MHCRGMNSMRNIIVALTLLLLEACTYTTPRYNYWPDTTEAIKKANASGVYVEPFTRTASIDTGCNVTAGTLALPDGLSYEGYIQDALVRELKKADAYDSASPKVMLSGVVEQLSIFADRNIYTSTWDINLRIKSSNGESALIRTSYDFQVNYSVKDRIPSPFTDCQTIADAYMSAVQQVVYQLVHSPDFKYLVKPKSD